MNIELIPIRQLKGRCVGFFAPMNGGKTKAVVGELERVEHSGYNCIDYNNSINVRDNNFLKVDLRYGCPAKAVRNITELRDDLEERISRIRSNTVGETVRKGMIEFGGIKHHKNLPLAAVGVDEVNLFCLTEKDASEFVDFMKYCNQQGLILYIAGLLYDFRQRPFGEVQYVLPHVDLRFNPNPACKAVHQGKQCGETAIHTQRLWRLDFAEEQGLAELLGEMDYFDFADKRGGKFIGKYVAAPFFDKTVRIDEARDGRNVYLPVCDECSRLSYKEVVFRVYDVLVNGGYTNQALKNKVLRNKILDFLADPDERWVIKEGDGFVPIPYHRNRLGGYSPK